MAKKPKHRSEVYQMLSDLNYSYNYLTHYADDNDYDHDFIINNLKNVIELIEKDKENKTQKENERQDQIDKG